LCAGGAFISGGDKGSRKDYRDEYGGVDAGRAFLWLYRHGRRGSGADEESDGRENESNRDGRAGGADRRGFALHRGGGRISDAGGIAIDLGTQSNCGGGGWVRGRCEKK